MLSREQSWSYHHAAAWNISISAMLPPPVKPEHHASSSLAPTSDRPGLRAGWRPASAGSRRLELGWWINRSR
jgi:hypothetical protein